MGLLIVGLHLLLEHLQNIKIVQNMFKWLKTEDYDVTSLFADKEDLFCEFRSSEQIWAVFYVRLSVF